MMKTWNRKQQVDKYYPEERDLFGEFLSENLSGYMNVLDCGCGDGSIYKYPYKDCVKFLVGVDLRNDLAENIQVHAATQASLDYLPYADASFDFIFSRFVLEHLENPEIAFRQFYRVLKPGGKLFILLPNDLHYFVLAGRIFPHKLQQKFAGLVGYKEEDTFPTFYRCNSQQKLLALARKTGLIPVKVYTHEPAPWFLSFSPITFFPAMLYERFTNKFDIFSPIRAHLFGLFEKQE